MYCVHTKYRPRILSHQWTLYFLNLNWQLCWYVPWKVLCNISRLGDCIMPRKNCPVLVKYILIHTCMVKYCQVHTMYIPVQESCTRTYTVHVSTGFLYWHVLVHTRYVLVHVFLKGFIPCVRIPDARRRPGGPARRERTVPRCQPRWPGATWKLDYN